MYGLGADTLHGHKITKYFFQLSRHKENSILPSEDVLIALTVHIATVDRKKKVTTRSIFSLWNKKGLRSDRHVSGAEDL